MIGNNFSNNQRGFTLAEMLVTVGVFSIAMMISSAVFININKLQQNTANMEKLQNEGRYVMEKIAKEVRGRELDYDQLIFSASGVTDSLVFKKDEFGEVFSLSFKPESKSIDISSLMDDVSDSASLSSDSVIVENAKFIVSPSTDPYSVSATGTPQLHPRVTILMTIKNRNVPADYQKQLNLQTTISSKIYR